MAVRGVAMIFSAQGSVGPLLDAEALREASVFAEAMRECDEAVRRRLGWSPLLELTEWTSSSWIRLHGRFQPIFTSLQIGLAREFLASGETVDAVAGVCAGEAAAFHVAGAYSLDDAIEVACAQSEVASRRGLAGALALVRFLPGGRERCRDPIAETGLHVACELSPSSLVLGGTKTALERLRTAVARDCAAFTPVDPGTACHLPDGESLERAFRRTLGPVHGRPTQVDLYSAVLGGRLAGAPSGADHWWNAFAGTGRFEAMVRELVQAGYRRFVEVSPVPTLRPFLEEICRAEGSSAYVVGVGCANRKSVVRSGR